MIVLGNNKITSDMITVTGGSSSLPASRCLNQVSIETTLFTKMVIDFGYAEYCEAVALVGENLDDMKTCVVSANSVNDFTSPPFTTTIDPVGGSRVLEEVFSAAKTYRYWEIKPSSGSYRLGYIYLGEKQDIPARNYGNLSSFERVDSQTSTVGGGILTKSGYKRRSLSASVNSATDDEYEDIMRYWYRNGAKPNIVIPYEDDDRTSIERQYTPFFCAINFEFNGRTNYNNNQIQLDCVERR